MTTSLKVGRLANKISEQFTIAPAQRFVIVP
jgi:hypothetical protein